MSDAAPAIDVSIIIPTIRRPGPLASATASALAQHLDEFTAELLIVDNDPGASARERVGQLADGAPMPVRYVHAAEPGVANARNAGVAASRGRFIAFLDDDEIASPGWLSALMETQRHFDADAVFGPVRAKLPAGAVKHRDYLTTFFSRLGPDQACTILEGPGCGDSLVRRDALPHPTAPFAVERNGIGGEDDLLFAAMKSAGARFAWAPDAWVWEVPEPSRLTLRYTLRRAFAFGQGPCSAAAAEKRWLAVPFWMAVGGAQVFTQLIRALIAIVTRSPNLAYRLDRAARGLGKILWFPPFKIGFYGQGALARQAADAQREALSPQARQAWRGA